MQTLCIIVAMISFSHSARAQLDLHAHLNLKPGMGILQRGSFDEAPQADDWSSRLHTKASGQSLVLLRSPKLIVVSFYAHPYFSRLFHFDVHENTQLALDEEYKSLVDFVQAHSQEWVIARSPAEARAALKENKRVFVLSLEGAANVVETPVDFNKWINERGVAIVTPFHLTEDNLGGSALLPNLIAGFNAPITFVRSIISSGGSCLFHFCKSQVGLKGEGEQLIRNLWKHQVWVDFAHANEIEIAELLPELESRKLPLLITHTELREAYPSERALGPLEAKYISLHDGLIGLVPSDDMLPRPLDDIKAEECHSGLARYKQTFQYARKQIGELKVAMASDVNAPLNGLSPLCTIITGELPSELEKKGYYTYSQWNELTQYVAENPDWNARIVERFLGLWEEVRSASR